jgi:hypothetical protein
LHNVRRTTYLYRKELGEAATAPHRTPDKMEMDKMPRKLWEHPDPKSTAIWKFMEEANRRHGLKMGVSLLLHT